MVQKTQVVLNLSKVSGFILRSTCDNDREPMPKTQGGGAVGETLWADDDSVP